MLIVFLATVFMALLDVSIVNVALPTIESSLDASQSQLQWILAGYALLFGLVLVPSGRLGDIFGRAPLFLIGVAIFVLASAACGLAPNAPALDIARCFQGFAAGVLNPQTIGMIQEYFRGKERGKAYGMLGATVGVATAVGPPAGGAIIAAAGPEAGWRWIFFINVPIGLATLVAALVFHPRPMIRPVEGRGRRDRDLDPVAMVLLGVGVFAVLLPFVRRGGALGGWIWASVAIGALLLYLFIRWEKRYGERGRTPMVDLRIFSIGSFSLGASLSTTYFAGMTSIWVLVSLFMQSGLGYSALAAGLIGLPCAVSSGTMSTLSSRRAFDYGRRIVVAGLVIVLVALAATIAVALLTTHGVSIWWWLLTLTVFGAGGGMVISPNQTLTLNEVPNEYAGSAGGVMQTGQRIGTAVGLAVITAVAFAVLGTGEQSSGGRWPIAFTAGLLAIMVFVVLSLLIGLRDVRSRDAGTSS
nr:MFS transporter [Spelaeicoccus albus]